MQGSSSGHDAGAWHIAVHGCLLRGPLACAPKRQNKERLPKLLGLPAHLMTRLAFSGRMTRLFTVMVTAIEQRTTYDATRHLFLGTTDVLDCGILATRARLGRQVRTRRAYVGFMAGVRCLWMAAAGGRSMARVSALNDGATMINESAPVHPPKANYSPSNRRLHDSPATGASQLVIRRFQAASARSLVIELGTRMYSATQQLATYEWTSMQAAFILFRERKLPLLSLGLCLVCKRTTDPAAFVSATTSQGVTHPVAQDHFARFVHFFPLPALHRNFAFSTPTDGNHVGLAGRTIAFVTRTATGVFTSGSGTRTRLAASRDGICAFLSGTGDKVDERGLGAWTMCNEFGGSRTG